MCASSVKLTPNTCSLQLCSTRYGREYLREKQTYLIIRELHQQEEEESVRQACENLIAMLISDEPESGMENLHEVEIPPHIAATLEVAANADST